MAKAAAKPAAAPQDSLRHVGGEEASNRQRRKKAWAAGHADENAAYDEESCMAVDRAMDCLNRASERVENTMELSDLLNPVLKPWKA